MKTLIAALLVAAAFTVPSAEATFQGVLTPGSDITVVGSYDVFADTTGMAALTVVYVKGNNLDVAGTLTIGGNGGEITLPLPNPVDRVIIQIDTRGVGNSFVVLVSQGGVRKGQIAVTGDGRLVFDVAP